MSADRQNGPQEPGYLNLADLSAELQINALQTLACPVIAIIPDGKQLGSGVLVEVDVVSGILTAEHVVFSEEFQQAKGLWTIPHFYLEADLNEPTTHFSSTNIRRDLLRYFPETPTAETTNGGRISLLSGYRKTRLLNRLCER
jgi:hypothetical protein